MKKPSRTEHTKNRIFEALKKPLTAQELASSIHISETSSRKYLRELRGNGIFISEWRLVGCFYVAVYRAGTKKDKQKTKFTKKQRYKRTMDNLRADPERYAKFLARKRVMSRPVKRDVLVGYFFGAKQ